MRILLLPLAAVSFGAAPPKAPAAMSSVNPYASGAACPDTPMSLARKQAEKPVLRRLTDLPNGAAFAAVDRRVGGCPAPLMLTRTRR